MLSPKGSRVPIHPWSFDIPLLRFMAHETLQVTVQALGWWGDRTFQPLTDEIDSVAYWYQALPTAPFPQLPGPEGRWPRLKRDWGGGPPSRPYTGGQPRQGML
jgi:hypothetical protein